MCPIYHQKKTASLSSLYFLCVVVCAYVLLSVCSLVFAQYIKERNLSKHYCFGHNHADGCIQILQYGSRVSVVQGL